MVTVASKERFDKDYYQRFYFDARTSVTSRAEMNARGRLIAAFAERFQGIITRNAADFRNILPTLKVIEP
jgi:hypothetical protein